MFTYLHKNPLRFTLSRLDEYTLEIYVFLAEGNVNTRYKSCV